MPNPTAAMLAIGDELLSGRTRDANTHHLARALSGRGIDLKEARVVADDRDAIVDALEVLRVNHANLFTSGGIGPTHDDITADAVAAAFGVHIGVREDARAALAAHYEKTGTEMNAARLRMARVPDGAELIDNPVSGAPGFSIGNVHVMAGVPEIFAAMLEGLLPKLAGGSPLVSETLRVDRPEGDIAGPLDKVARAHPGLSIGSYPFRQDGVLGANLVIRGSDPEEVAAALATLRTAFAETSR